MHKQLRNIPQKKTMDDKECSSSKTSLTTILPSLSPSCFVVERKGKQRVLSFVFQSYIATNITLKWSMVEKVLTPMSMDITSAVAMETNNICHHHNNNMHPLIIIN